MDKKQLQEALDRNRDIALVVNTHSRRGEADCQELEAALIEVGFSISATARVAEPQRLSGAVRDMVDRGYKLVVVGGGDGSLSSVARHFVNKDSVLGVIPMGTANSFAKEIGIPATVREAATVIATGRVEDIDVPAINGASFLNTAAIGLAPVVAKAAPKGLKRWLGPIAYIFVGVYELARLRSFEVSILSEGKQLRLNAFQVLIANGSYFGGIKVAPDAHPESRNVTIQVLLGPDRANLVRAWWAIARGRKPDRSVQFEMRTAEAVIRTDPILPISLDGEVTQRTPADVTIMCEALNLIVPAKFPDYDQV